MAAFTSKATGNWSASGQTTWNEVGVPGSGDTVTIGSSHTVTVDVDTTCGGLAMNGPLTIAAGKIFTLVGNCIQGNALYTMSAGSQLVFDTTAADRKWLLGTAGNQANCKWVVNGSSGSRCQVRKTGGHYAWCDAGDENAGGFGNNGGLVATYCDFAGLHASDGILAFGSDDFGIMDRRLLHCTLDDCGVFFSARPYIWSGAVANKDWRMEDCVLTNPPSSALSYAYMYFVNVGVGSGTISFLRNSVGENTNKYSVYMSPGPSAHVDDNYFDSCCYNAGGDFASFLRNTVRLSSNLQTLGGGMTSVPPTYMLCDHVDPADRENGVTSVGNPHVIIISGTACTFDGVVIDYPHPLLIDGGDGMYATPETGPFTGSVIKNCMVIPSCADGYSGANLHHMISGNNRITMLHNTAVGITAQLTFNEANQGSGVDVSEMKSNLIAGVSQVGANWGAAVYDLFWLAFGGVDIVTPSGIKNNYSYMPVPAGYIDTTGMIPPGAANGFHMALSTSLDVSNLVDTTVGPQFVDGTRCAAKWAAYKGYVAPSDLTNNHNRRVALDAVRVALMADPTLGHNDLLPWVRDGYVPTNAALDGTAHDGGTIGAMPFSGGGGGGPTGGFGSVFAGGLR